MFIHSQHFNPNVLEFSSIIHSKFTQKVRQLQMYYFKLNIKWLLFKAYYYLNDYLRTFGTIHVASIIMIKEILLKKTLSELYQHSKFLFNIWYLLFDRFDITVYMYLIDPQNNDLKTSYQIWFNEYTLFKVIGIISLHISWWKKKIIHFYYTYLV